jgi:hypothetical protein
MTENRSGASRDDRRRHARRGVAGRTIVADECVRSPSASPLKSVSPEDGATPAANHRQARVHRPESLATITAQRARHRAIRRNALSLRRADHHRRPPRSGADCIARGDLAIRSAFERAAGHAPGPPAWRRRAPAARPAASHGPYGRESRPDRFQRRATPARRGGSRPARPAAVEGRRRRAGHGGCIEPASRSCHQRRGLAVVRNDPASAATAAAARRGRSGIFAQVKRFGPRDRRL